MGQKPSNIPPSGIDIVRDDEFIPEDNESQPNSRWIVAQPRTVSQDQRIAQLQHRIDEVKGIVIDNIQQALSRGEQLEVLSDRSENLMQESVKVFRNTNKLRKKKAWQARKWTIVCIIVSILVFLVLGGGIVLSFIFGWF